MATGPQLDRVPWYLLLIFLLLACGIGLAGYLYYIQEKGQLRRDQETELTSISSLKAGQLAAWRTERMSDAMFLQSDPVIAEMVGQTVLTEIHSYLNALQTHSQYRSITVLRPNGSVVLSIPESIIPDSVVLATARTTTKDFRFSDMYPEPGSGEFRLNVIVPILNRQRSDSTIAAVIVLTVDPSRFLYPLLGTWPTASQTGQTFLVQCVGQNVVFLSELHGQEGGTLRRVPAGDVELPASIAIRGREGTEEGIDYRGINVIATLRQVAGSPWYLVTALDRDEMYQPIRERALWIGLLAGILIATAGIAVMSFWREQRLKFYQRQYEIELERQALERHYALLTRHANDIILLMDRDWNIVDANDRAFKAYGLTRAELLALNMRALHPADEVAAFDNARAVLETREGYLHETQHIRKDGTRFPVEISSRVIHVETEVFHQAIIRDISERQEAAEALRSSNTFLRSILESSSTISIISTDPEGSILFWNKGAESILGYTADEMVGKHNVNILYDPADAEAQATVARIRQGVRETRVPMTVEVRERTKDGRTLWMKLTASPRLDASGAVVGILGIAEDITERKTAEEASTQAERELRLLAFTVNCARDCFCVTDLEGGIIFANQSLLETYGYTEEALLGHPVAVLYPDAVVAEEIQRKTRDGGWIGEVLHKRKDGVEFPIELRTSVVRNDEGGPVALLSVARDISTRKHTEEALSLQTAYFEQLFENSPQAIVIVDPEDRLINVNPAFETLFQYHLEEVRGRLVNEVLVPNSLSGEGSHLSGSVLDGRVIQKESVRRRKDGSLVDVSILGFPIRLSEKQIAVYGVYTDITERKRAEKVRVVLYKISEAANAAKDLDELYRLIHAILGEVMAADNFYIALYDPADKLVRFPYFVDQFDTPPPAHSPGRGLTDYVLRSGLPLLASPDVFEHLVQQGEVESMGAPSVDWVGIPLKVEDRTIGVMVLQSYTENVRYTNQEAEVLKFVSTQIAMAIERKLADEALRQNEQRYRLLYNNTPVMLYSIDREGRLLSVSDYWVSVMGYERQEVLGRRAADFLTTPSHAYAQNIVFPELMRAGRVKDIEHQLVKKSGEIMDVLFSAIAETDARGNFIRALAVMIDVTERKRIMEQLRESKESALAVLNATAETLILTDAAGTVLAVNQTGADRLGRSVEELVGFDIYGILPPALAATRRARAGEVVRTGIPQRFEDERGGMFFDTTIFPVRNEDGTITRTVIFGQDITKRKVAEERLLTLSRAIEQSPTSIVITDVSGKIEYVNPKFTRVTGYAADEVLGKNPRILKSSRTSPAVYKELWETITAGKEWLGQMENKKKNGEYFWEFVSISSVTDGRGAITHYIAVKEDITERRNLEEQLRQAQKLESLGTLAGGIAHDVNNILAIILGHASMMERKAGDPARLSQGVDAITRAVNRGTGLVRQLLTFARKSEVAFEAVSANATIEELVKMLEETFPRTISFSLRLDKSLPAIIADGSQLHQSLLNLCVNARDAMHAEGGIAISTSLAAGADVRHRFSGALEEQYVCIAVADTGSGMDEQTRSHIFEPFFTTKGVGKGTGLGLAVVYGVVNSHHGFVDVETEVGRGTTFRLYFPAPPREAEAGDTPVETLAEPAGGTETILVVEDEEMLLEIISGLLESKGYTVITACDGMQAIDSYRKHCDRIALVLTDLGLPKLGGWEAVQQMMELNPRLPVIVATGYLDPHAKVKMLSGGARQFVQKPYVPTEIVRRVREVLDAPVA